MAGFRSILRTVAASVVPFSAVLLALAAAAPVDPERVSFGNEDATPDGPSYEGTVSGNGRYVAFQSYATNLLPEEGNDAGDIFVRDRKLGTTALVSADANGDEGNDHSTSPCLSDNGRFVSFYSRASNLAGADDGDYFDVFLTDRKTGETTRLSEDAEGVQGDGHSYHWGASISKNGRYAVFYSGASNIATDGEDDNQHFDVFLHDRVKGTTTLVSRNLDGDASNGHSYDGSLSPNGRFVAYYSSGTDLVEDDPDGVTNSIFVYDTRKKTTAILPLGTGETGADEHSYGPCVSDNGRWVAFESEATDLVEGQPEIDSQQVFLTDRKSGVTTMVSKDEGGTPGDDESRDPDISANGKTVVFSSEAGNLVDDDANGGNYDVFRLDPKTGVLRLISRNADGDVGNAGCYSWGAALSSNGKYVVFGSDATNFDSAGAAGMSDTFVVKLGK